MATDIRLNEQMVNELLGDLMYVSSDPRYVRDSSNRATEEIESIKINLASSKIKGGSISFNVDTNVVPNIKPFAKVKLINGVYHPTAGSFENNGRVNAYVIDGYRADGIEPVNKNDVLADPETGEKKVDIKK